VLRWWCCPLAKAISCERSGVMTSPVFGLPDAQPYCRLVDVDVVL